MPDTTRVDAFRAFARQEKRLQERRKKRGKFWAKVLFWIALATFAAGLLFFLSGCSLPSDGWFQRMELQTSQIREASQKIEINTAALAETIADDAIQAERKRRHALVPVSPSPDSVPPDRSPFSWLETLLYILLGVSGFGVLGGRHALLKGLRAAVNGKNENA